MGVVEKVENLGDVMHKKYKKGTVLLVDKITGEEEVPDNVKAIVLLNSDDYPDVLAHVSVRARNLKVMLTVLFDDEKCKQLENLQGMNTILKIANGDVSF